MLFIILKTDKIYKTTKKDVKLFFCNATEYQHSLLYNSLELLIVLFFMYSCMIRSLTTRKKNITLIALIAKARSAKKITMEIDFIL